MIPQIWDQLQHLQEESKSIKALLQRKMFKVSFKYALPSCRRLDTWLEIGHTSTGTPIFLESSFARGWCAKANPCPMRDVLNNRASRTFLSTSVPYESINTHIHAINRIIVYVECMHNRICSRTQWLGIDIKLTSGDFGEYRNITSHFLLLL